MNVLEEGSLELFNYASEFAAILLSFLVVYHSI